MFAESKKTKSKGRPDEDLFGNTDDIFGDIPESKPKVSKTKKKKKTTKPTMKSETEPVIVDEPTSIPPTEG